MIAFFGFFGLLIGLIIDSYDPLLRFERFRENSYFRKYFPHNHLKEVCDKCSKKKSCKNALDKESCIPAWFYIYDNLLSEYLRNFIFMISALSRVVFYLKYISLLFIGLTLTLMLIYSYSYMAFFFWNVYIVKNSSFLEWLFRFFFIIFLILVYEIINISNYPGDKPTGIWVKWRNLSRDLKFWIKINKETFKKVICEQSIPYGK